MILRTDNHITGSLINFSSQNKVYYSGETFSDYLKMIVFPFLNPHMIKVAFPFWLFNFNSIKEDEADQTNIEGSISSSLLFFFPFLFCLILSYHPHGSVNSITILPTNM